MTGRTRDFTLRQLSTFVTAARAGSFAQAADELGISQPAVSDHIAMLEKRIGHRLFSRRRGTTPLLTREGHELLRRAETLLSNSTAIRNEVGAAAAAEARRVRVRLCIGPLLRDYYLKPMLPKFYRDHPEIEIEMVPVIPLKEGPASLERGRIDLLVYTTGRMLDDWPDTRLLCSVPTVMVASRDIADKLKSGTSTIEDQTFILPSTEHVAGRWVEKQLKALGYSLRRHALYVDFPDVHIQMVEEGAGVSIMMREHVAASLASGRLVEIGPSMPDLQRIIMRSPVAPPEARVVEEALVRAMGSSPELITAD